MDLKDLSVFSTKRPPIFFLNYNPEFLDHVDYKTKLLRNYVSKHKNQTYPDERTGDSSIMCTNFTYFFFFFFE